MKRILITLLTGGAIASGAGGLALLAADALAHTGVFGVCFGDGCHHAARHVGFPVIAINLAVIGCTLWIAWRGGR